MIYAPSAVLLHPLTNAYAFMDFSCQLAARCFCLEEEIKIPNTELRLVTHYKPSAACSWPSSTLQELGGTQQNDQATGLQQTGGNIFSLRV